MSRVLTAIKKPLPPSSRRWTYRSKAGRYCSPASYPHPLGCVVVPDASASAFKRPSLLNDASHKPVGFYLFLFQAQS
jgi:hypothetical protein